MKDFGILADFAGIAVTDRYGNYFHTTWKNISGHQACLSRILRDLQTARKATPGSTGPPRPGNPRAPIHARNQASGDGLAAIPAATRNPWSCCSAARSPSPWPTCPASRPQEQHERAPGRDMPEFCRDREADVLRSTTDTDVWPTNNISESGLRPSKTQQEISGRADQRRHHPGPP